MEHVDTLKQKRDMSISQNLEDRKVNSVYNRDYLETNAVLVDLNLEAVGYCSWQPLKTF